MEIEIKHQEYKTNFKFKVKDDKKLSSSEVKRICEKMGVNALFINGKYYTLK